MKKKVSIHDIARELNVSATTVSFVINGKAEEKRISEDLKDKIQRYVKKIGYQPNMVAKSLRTGKSHLIAMLVEDIGDPFFASISRRVEVEAHAFGYKIFYASTENDPEKTKALIKVFKDRQVDGYIIAPPPGIEQEIQSLMEDKFPVILFDRYFPKLKTTNVVVDNYQGAFDAVSHLASGGFNNIGLVTLESEQTQMKERLRGYEEAIAAFKRKSYILRLPYKQDQENAVAKIKAFIHKHPKMDAVLFTTNYLAISGLQAIAELNIRIPGDLGVVGFDDNSHFSLFSPSVTAVAQPIEEISKEVVKQLMSRLSDGKDTKVANTVLPTKLMIRNSSVRKPAERKGKIHINQNQSAVPLPKLG